jgi:large subunit ribosomal protein L9
MKVILLERVERLGALGDVVNVRDGFARNFLLPRSKALRASEANLKVFEAQRKDIEARNASARDAAEKASKKVDGESYVIIRQAGESGQLYGSVSGRDVADAIQAEGGKVDRAMVVLDRPIKNLGVHPVKVRLHPEVAVTVNVNVARSQDEAVRQARGENVITSQFDEDRIQAQQAAEELFEGGAGQALIEPEAEPEAEVQPEA